MQPLADETQGSLYLALRDGLEMVVIEACRATASMLSARVDTGTRTPLATSALGRAYLSGIEQPVRDQLLDQLRHRHAGAWPAVGEQLQLALAVAQKTGYCISLGTFHPDINSVSMPFRGPTGEVFSVNCGGAAFRFSESRLIDEIVPRLTGLTRALAQAMGGHLIETNKASVV
jgi:DNA-binding IclR family transcriptional regulator